eukprot:7655_1
MPYWPAQHIFGGTGDSKMVINTFNDPSLTVNINEDETNNKRRKKWKKHLRKQLIVPHCKILEWLALKKNGEPIAPEDILNEYVTRKKLKSIDYINDNIFEQWNKHAVGEAHEERLRLHNLEILEEKRNKEREELAKAHFDEEKKKNKMKGKLYDGRINGIGWTLNAGDSIRYWATGQMTNQPTLITTKIIQLYDKYGTERSKSTVPIIVQCGLNPPFWDTKIELLPTKDPMNPIYFSLKRCKFIPGAIENEMEIKHMKEAEEWDKKMRKTKFGSMVANTTFNRNN